ncbi:cytochrome c1 [Roseobacteraceae bacterium S113]
MFKKVTLSAIAALGLMAGAASAAGSYDTEIKNVPFSFDGPFGTFDQMQLQRGLQVYTEVCSGCHGLQYVPLRTLSDTGGPGLPEDQVRAYAEQNFEVWDPELADGDGDFREARPSDNFPANTAVGAPDLSMMAKARAGFHGPYGLGINQMLYGIGGAEYIYSLLTGYTGEEKEEAGVILYENKAFPGGWISMGPPLYGDDVEFADGHATDISSISKDVSAFLMWTAEPKMMARKEAGFVGALFLAVLSVLLYLTNKRLWAPVKKQAKLAGRATTPAE